MRAVDLGQCRRPRHELDHVIELHADLGRIDYAIVDGTAVVYDVSRTPVMHEDALAVHGDELVALANGIDAFLS